MASDLITAILPICIQSNPFWGSAKGLECIKRFLAMVKGVEGIDQYIVVTMDDQINCLAREYDMGAISIDFFSSPNRAYTFEESRSIAGCVKEAYQGLSDVLIVMDHRNILLAPYDIQEAIAMYYRKPGSCIVSLMCLTDYPCQYKSFSSFLGCTVIYIDQSCKDEKLSSSTLPSNPFRETNCSFKSHGDLAIHIVDRNSHFGISFHPQALSRDGVVAHIIPFDETGPQYVQAFELLIPRQDEKLFFDVESSKPKGFIFIFTHLSHGNEYDTAELFAPLKAPWRFSGTGSIMIDKNTNEPMFGRQKFPVAYTYDGSICVLGMHDLSNEAPKNFKPIQLKNTCIVTDWLDYWYATIQFDHHAVN